MNRREAKTVPVHELPTVLVLGCTREFVDRCRESAAKTGAIVRATELAGAETMAATCHPLAIVLTARSYQAERVRFDDLAETSESKLVQVPAEDLPQADLERMVVTAVTEARRFRSSAPPA
jgi:hypothetical protein